MVFFELTMFLNVVFPVVWFGFTITSPIFNASARKACTNKFEYEVAGIAIHLDSLINYLYVGRSMELPFKNMLDILYVMGRLCFFKFFHFLQRQIALHSLEVPI
jgi:hypothetical protein